MDPQYQQQTPLPEPQAGQPLSQQPQAPQSGQPAPQQPLQQAFQPKTPQMPTQDVANKYDYILNAPTNKKRLLIPGGQNKTLAMVIFVVGFFFVLMILFVVFNSLTKKDYGAYIKLAQKQSEIIRVADIGVDKARSADSKYYVRTIREVTASEQADTLAYLKKSGNSVNAKQLVLLKDPATDKKLTTAEQTSTYDETLLSTINSLVIDYEKSAKSATASASGPTEKSLAATLNSNAKVLLNAK